MLGQPLSDFQRRTLLMSLPRERRPPSLYAETLECPSLHIGSITNRRCRYSYVSRIDFDEDLVLNPIEVD